MSETPVLESKSAILNYIEATRLEVKAGLEEEVVKERYTMIATAIEAMKAKVKPNTTSYLNNQLRQALGKYQPAREEEGHNYFVEFFKEAYPDGKRRKDFTWALVDRNHFSVEQILTTLKHINGFCLKNRLPKEAKADILPMIEKVAQTNNLKYINQIRSMEGIRKAVRIKIIATPKGHKVVNC